MTLETSNLNTITFKSERIINLYIITLFVRDNIIILKRVVEITIGI